MLIEIGERLCVDIDKINLIRINPRTCEPKGYFTIGDDKEQHYLMEEEYHSIVAALRKK